METVMPTTAPSFLVWLLSRRREDSSRKVSPFPKVRPHGSASCTSGHHPEISTHAGADGTCPSLQDTKAVPLCRFATKSDLLSAQKSSPCIRPRNGDL